MKCLPESGIAGNTCEIAFTIVESKGALTKTFGCEFEQPPRGSAAPTLPRGVARRVTLTAAPTEILRELARRLTGLQSSEAIIVAPPPPNRDEWQIRTEGEEQPDAAIIARSKRWFRAAEGVTGLLVLDVDAKKLPRRIERALRGGGLGNALGAVFPAFLLAACLRRPSVSSGVVAPDGQSTPSGSEHRYYVIRDCADAAPFARRLADRLALEGLGWCEPSSHGKPLHRTLIDAAASDPSRLVFEADALLQNGTRYKPSARMPELKQGGLLDTRLLAPLTEEERARLETIKRQNEVEVAEECAAKRAQWSEERRRRLVEKGVEPGEADAAVKAIYERCELDPSWEIHLDDKRVVTVAEILAAPAEFHEKTCADPLEPEYGRGRNLAIIYTDDTPNITSLAHGGIVYHLRGRPDPAAFFKDETANALSTETRLPAAASGGGWPEPFDIFGDADPLELGELPAGCVPRVIEQWAASEAPSLRVSPVFAAVAGVATMGAAIGNALRVQVRLNNRRFVVPAALWVVLVAKPGTGKSPLIDAALAPAREVDQERYREWQREEQRRKLLLEGKKGKASESPPARRLIVDDATIEKQLVLHAQNPRGLLRTPDEFKGVLDSLGAYKQGGGGDRTHLLRMFDGGEIIVDRVKHSAPIRAGSALLSILAGTQPEVIEKLASDLGSDGLLQRCLFVSDDGRARPRVDLPSDEAACAGYASAVRSLMTMEPEKAVLRLSLEARGVLDEFLAFIDRLTALLGAGPAWQGHLSKWEGLLGRLVMIFHAVEAVTEGFGMVLPSVPVHAATARRAVAFARVLLRHSLHFHSEYMDATTEATLGRWFAGHLLTRPEKHSFSGRDCGQIKGELRDARTRRVVMDELESFGWVRASGRADRDGPKSWEVNPLIHDRFRDRAAREMRERNERRLGIERAAEARRELSEQVVREEG